MDYFTLLTDHAIRGLLLLGAPHPTEILSEEDTAASALTRKGRKRGNSAGGSPQGGGFLRRLICCAAAPKESSGGEDEDEDSGVVSGKDHGTALTDSEVDTVRGSDASR